jgi:single-strand DNA-binding protein
MSGSLNKVQLIGHLGHSPQIRNTQDGKKVANLSIATSESWKDKNTNERQTKVEWHKVVIFNERLCDVVEQYLKKGSQIYIEGQLQTRKWTDKEGKERYTTEVVLQKFKGELVMLGGKESQQDEGFEEVPYMTKTDDIPKSPYYPNGTQTQSMKDFYKELDDEIPF